MAASSLPRATDDEQAERLYDALAEFAGCEPAPVGQRVPAIVFTATASSGSRRSGRS